MSTALVIASFLRIARGDLDDAVRLADGPSRNAAYLCEQAAEKILRAVLTAEGLHVERAIAHRLDRLVDLLPEASAFKSRFASVEGLSAYATAFRYPTAGGRIPHAPSRSELDAALAATRLLLTDVAQAFRVDLDAVATMPAGTVTPPRLGKT
jgi:HEPN domain-containing protein